MNKNYTLNPFSRGVLWPWKRQKNHSYVYRQILSQTFYLICSPENAFIFPKTPISALSHPPKVICFPVKDLSHLSPSPIKAPNSNHLLEFLITEFSHMYHIAHVNAVFFLLLICLCQFNSQTSDVERNRAEVKIFPPLHNIVKRAIKGQGKPNGF